MSPRQQLLFFVDESLPIRRLRTILAGHKIRQVDLQTFDPEILISAEQQSAVLIVQDKRFIRDLFQYPRDHPHCMKHAGVIQLPGEWQKAEPRLIKYLPVIRQLWRIARSQPEDQRFSIDLSRAEIRIKDPF